MKCQECNREAKWVIYGLSPYDEKTYFYPLCEEHFEEIRGMEGEMNMDFDLIDGLAMEELFHKANEQIEYLNKKIAWCFQENSKLKGEAKENSEETVKQWLKKHPKRLLSTKETGEAKEQMSGTLVRRKNFPEQEFFVGDYVFLMAAPRETIYVITQVIKKDDCFEYPLRDATYLEQLQFKLGRIRLSLDQRINNQRAGQTNEVPYGGKSKR